MPAAVSAAAIVKRGIGGLTLKGLEELQAMARIKDDPALKALLADLDAVRVAALASQDAARESIRCADAGMLKLEARAREVEAAEQALAEGRDAARASHEAEAGRLKKWSDSLGREQAVLDRKKAEHTAAVDAHTSNARVASEALEARAADLVRREKKLASDALLVAQAQDEAEKALTRAQEMIAMTQRREADLRAALA